MFIIMADLFFAVFFFLCQHNIYIDIRNSKAFLSNLRHGFSLLYKEINGTVVQCQYSRFVITNNLDIKDCTVVF